MDPLSIEGAWVIKPLIRPDARGSFVEIFSGRQLLRMLGHPMDVA